MLLSRLSLLVIALLAEAGVSAADSNSNQERQELEMNGKAASSDREKRQIAEGGKR